MTYQKPLPKPLYPPVDQGSLKAFTYYKEFIEYFGVKPVNHTEIENGDTTSLEHLLWMIEHCIPRIRDDGLGFNVSKYSRWLGYIQGCLICKGYTTVAQERDRTRNFFTE
jgi:hypothetical protein